MGMLVKLLLNRPGGISDDEFIISATKQFVKQLSEQLQMSERHVAQHIYEESVQFIIK